LVVVSADGVKVNLWKKLDYEERTDPAE